jgi:hypothetical protein
VPSVTFVCRAPHVTHDKVCSPCVIEEGARQREFTVQKATVCPLPCASTKNAWQSHCRAFSSLCRAPETHGKARVSRSDLSMGLLLFCWRISWSLFVEFQHSFILWVVAADFFF